jgi:hypothetical protein
MRTLSPAPRALSRSDTGDIDIRIADERVAALWADSAAALDELPDQLPVVRKAVRAR